ncbi:hypothetical protein F66182_6218 [Fusarium sp. NRRL 66182]|nr:hypothetical protein F66182_6218 [Fusarium sp. NRRL 66182]
MSSHLLSIYAVRPILHILRSGTSTKRTVSQMVSEKNREREIYLACKGIFKGPYAQLRQSSPVQRRINTMESDTNVKDVLQKYTTDQVVKVSRTLLKAGVFDSEQAAVAHFGKKESSLPPKSKASKPGSPKPKVHKSTPQKSEASGPGAVKLEYPEAISLDLSGTILTNAGRLSNISNKSVDEGKQEEESQRGTLETSTGSDTKGNLDPAMSSVMEKTTNTPVTKCSQTVEATDLKVFLPLPTQVLILSRVQTILEQACFQFAKENMPDVLSMNHWTCPEAGELDVWVKQFRRKENELARLSRSSLKDCSLSDLFHSARMIRNIAVHRNSIEVDYLKSLVDDAVNFCAILGTNDALKKLKTIQVCTESQIAELEVFKCDLDEGLDSTLADLAAQQAKLKALRQETIKKAHDELSGQCFEACKKLDKVLIDKEMGAAFEKNALAVLVTVQPMFWERAWHHSVEPWNSLLSPLRLFIQKFHPLGEYGHVSSMVILVLGLVISFAAGKWLGDNLSHHTSSHIFGISSV